MNYQTVKDSVKWLFSKRRPDLPPNDRDYLIRSWADDLMKIEGMTDKKVIDGCQEFSHSKERFDLPNLINTIHYMANKEAQEIRRKREKEEYVEGRKQAGKAPKATTLAISMWENKKDETFEETVERQDKLLRAYDEEIENSSGEMQRSWIIEKAKYKKHCDSWRNRKNDN